ncbi:MAG: pirin family protein [Bacteroidetes bacterium]|nr:MAG: pirin family protein [Bacteroidota bacterium]
MKTTYYPSDSRGKADHGWLSARHSFSFASYYNPERMHFGSLRVLNDDTIAPGKGFGMHPHDNMEIITIPLEGALAHEDSMGNGSTIQSGDVQVMSAGSGIWHSEFNASKEEVCKILQIWVFPNQRQVEPRYDQLTIPLGKMENQLFQVVSPNQDDSGLWIHQRAWFYLGKFNRGKQISYSGKHPENGQYLFLLHGKAMIGDQELNERDALSIEDTTQFDLRFSEDTYILIMDIPMHI